MTRNGKLVFAIAASALALVLGMMASRGAPPVVPVPALTPAQMSELAPPPSAPQATADEELNATPPEPDGDGS